MTYQDIIDRIEALSREKSAAYRAEEARIKREHASLQELCGGLGHFYCKDRSPYGFTGGRSCVFCLQPEPKAVATQPAANNPQPFAPQSQAQNPWAPIY